MRKSKSKTPSLSKTIRMLTKDLSEKSDIVRLLEEEKAALLRQIENQKTQLSQLSATRYSLEEELRTARGIRAGLRLWVSGK